MRNKMMKNQAGFTLIELMIVVGIIGILVSIAAPNFARYQSKARQSEAKIALAAVYGAEKSFYSEYAAYIGSMDAIGYTPEGNRRFYRVGWAADPAGNVTGYAGGTLNGFWATINTPYSSCTTWSTGDAATTADVQTFLAVASGCIRQGLTNADNWNMTDTKVLSNNAVNL
jgi:prepilin-type N-terminal cleavage/methylation domain-containing protein